MITHSAIKDIDGNIWSLPKPLRHHDVIHFMCQQRGKEEAHKLLGSQDQGFLNDKGEFLTRKEAWVEALKNNQILPPYHPTDPSKRLKSWDWSNEGVRDLFSEDLW